MAQGFEFTQGGGPSSFALDTPAAPTSAASNVQAQQGSAQLRGAVQADAPQGNILNVDAAMQRTNETLKVIGDLAQGVLGPKIEAARQEAFWTGVQRAAAGQAIQDIQKEQPWYSRIFGDSDVVQGARAYEAQTRVTDVAAQFQNDLPELAKQDPKAVTQVIMDRLNAARTGDPIADAVIQKAAIEAVPTFLKAHAKARYGYLQQEASRAEGASWSSGAALLQAAGTNYANGTISKSDMDAATAQFLQSLAPAPGRDPESYEKSLTTNILSMANAGNFHAIAALRDAGVMGQLSNEQAQRVDRGIESAQNRLKGHLGNEILGDDLWKFHVMLRTNPPTPDTVVKTAQAINTKFRQATGLDSDLIDPIKSAETGAMTLYHADEREQARADRRQEKLDLALERQAEKDRSLATAGVGFASGLGKNAYNSLKLDEVEASSVFRSQYASAPDKNAFLIKNVMAPIPYVDPNVSGELQSVIKANQGQAYSQGFQAAYGQWKQLTSIPNGGMATAAAYLGEENKKMMAFDDRIRSGAVPEVAYHQVYVEGVSHQPALGKDDRKTLKGVVKDNWTSFAQAWWPGTPDNPSDATLNMITSLVAEEYQSLRSYSPGRDPKDAFSQAAVNLKNRGLEVYGEYGFMSTQGSEPLTKLIGPNEKQLGLVMQDVVNGKFKAMGVKNYDDHTIVRLPDRDGKATLYIMALDKGQPYTATVTSDELKSAYDKATAAKVRTPGQQDPTIPIVFDGMVP